MLLKTLLTFTMSSLLACFALGAKENCEKCHDTCKAKNQCFDRVIVLMADTTVPFNPAPLDPFHAKMIASELYTKEQADANTAEALVDFFNKTGIDFSLTNPEVQYDPNTDIRFLPNVGIFASGAIINDVFVVSDSAHPERGTKDNIWYEVEYGNYVIFEFKGQFPGGLLKGQNYYANGVYGYADANLLQCESNFVIPCSREIIRQRNFFMSNTFPLQTQASLPAGFLGYANNINILDSDGNAGIWIGTGTAIQDIYGQDINIFRGTSVLSWPVMSPPRPL